MKNILSIDFGGMSVKYLLLNDGKELFETSTKSDLILATHELAAQDVVRVYNMLSNKYGEINGIAISFNSPVINESFVNWTHIVANPEYRDMKKILVDEGIPSNCPITMLNDGKAAVYAEVHNGSAKGYSNIVMLTIGTAIGGGVILNDKLVVGNSGLGGEISCILMNYDYDDYSKISTWHEFVSMTVLEKEYKKNTGTKLTGKEIFQKYDSNDKDATKVVEDLIRKLAVIIYNTIYAYGQEITVIGGGLSNRPGIADKVKIELNKMGKRMGMSVPTKIVVASYKNKAGIYGAYFHHLNNV